MPVPPIIPNPARILGGARDLVQHPTAVAEGLLPGAEGVQAGLDAVIAVRRWLSDRHNWSRVAWFGGGVVLVLAGAAMLARPAVTSAVGAVADVVPVGKVAKAVKGATK